MKQLSLIPRCDNAGRAPGVVGKAKQRAEHSKAPASKLLAEADRVIATFPAIMTTKTKHQAKGQVLCLFLSALAAGRQEMAV